MHKRKAYEDISIYAKRHHTSHRHRGLKRLGDELESGRGIAQRAAAVSTSFRKRPGDDQTPGSGRRVRFTPTTPGGVRSRKRGSGGDGPSGPRRRVNPRELFPGGGSASGGVSILAPPATDTALSALVAVLASVAAACVVLVRHTRATFVCKTHGDDSERSADSGDARP